MTWLQDILIKTERYGSAGTQIDSTRFKHGEDDT